MTTHFHNIGDLISRDDTSSFTLSADLSRHAILVGLEDGSLMQTDSRRVYIHIAKDDICIVESRGQP